MKKSLKALTLILAVTAVGAVGCSPPQTVDFVDIDRYLGTWYEIARYPTSFQEGCYGETTAVYDPHPEFPGDIRVTNTCRLDSPEGELDIIVGRAEVADEETNAKLKVYFFGSFGAPYWIIDLDPTPGDDPYVYAVVSEPTRSFLWILSRTPTLDDTTLNGILDRIVEQGLEPEKLQWTLQILG